MFWRLAEKERGKHSEQIFSTLNVYSTYIMKQRNGFQITEQFQLSFVCFNLRV